MSYVLRDSMAITYFPSGTEIRFVVDDVQMFIGRLMKPSKNLKSGGGNLVAYDYSVFLSQSSISLKYKNATANEVLDDICKRYGMSVQPNSKFTMHHSDIVIGKTGITTINQVLKDESDRSGVEYFTRTKDRVLYPLEVGSIMAKYELNPNQNITDIALSEDALSVVNEVEVVNNAGEIIDTISDEDMIESLGGKLTKSLQVSDGWQEKAKSALKPIKYTYTFKGLTENVDVSFISGNKVKLVSAAGDEYFIIESDSHVFDGAKHSVDMKLRLIEGAA